MRFERSRSRNLDRPRRRKKKRHGRSGEGQRRGTLRLGLVLATLVAVNVYVFFFKDGLRFGDVMDKAHAAILKAREARKPPRSPEASPDAVVEGELKTGETVQRALVRAGVASKEAQQVARALAPVTRRGTAGDTFVLRLDHERPELQQVASLEYHARAGSHTTLVRDADRFVLRH